MESMIRIACLFVTVALAAALLPVRVHAQQAAPVALTSTNVGVVDIARVGQEYKTLLEKNSQLETLATSLTSEVQARQAYPFVTEEEIQQLLGVLKLETRTPEQEAQLKKLTDESQKREAELLQLESKQDPSDQEKSRRNELRQIKQAAAEHLDQVRNAYSAQLDAQRQKIEGEVVEAVRKAITEVAGEKGLPLVFDKDAILFGGTDITDPVLTKLNAEAPAAAPAAATPPAATPAAGGAAATPGAAPQGQ